MTLRDCRSIKGTQGIGPGLLDSPTGCLLRCCSFMQQFMRLHRVLSCFIEYQVIITNLSNRLLVLSSSYNLLLKEIDENILITDFGRSVWDIVEISSVVWEFPESERHQQKRLNLHSQICVIPTITLLSPILHCTSHFRGRWSEFICLSRPLITLNW